MIAICPTMYNEYLRFMGEMQPTKPISLYGNPIAFLSVFHTWHEQKTPWPWQVWNKNTMEGPSHGAVVCHS